MTGHWEMMGLEIKTPFQTFTVLDFLKKLVRHWKGNWSSNVIGNKAASGTENLDELEEETRQVHDRVCLI